MYTILVCDDNTLYSSEKEVIMHRSKLVDKLRFIVHSTYKDIDMTDASVVMEYLLPVSKKYKSEHLILSEERYKDCYLQYMLPFDTNITSEAGKVEVQLTFIKTELDENGKGIQRVRKTSPTVINITPIMAWSDIIPDDALTSLDQRILYQDAQIRALNDLANAFNGNMVDNLVYDSADETLQLMAKGNGIGDKVSVRDMIDEGIPVVDLDSTSGDSSNTKPEDGCDCNHNCNCENNVVEFGYVPNVDSTEPTSKDDGVVEF